MRSKSKSSNDIILDYSKCRYECVVSKKKFLGTTKRFLYIFENEIVFNKESMKKKPDRILLIDLTKRVIWKYCDKKQPGKRLLKGFTLDYVNKSYEYYGEEACLVELKKQFARILFQAKVQDEYEAQCVVGQGNYALVLELKHLHSSLKLASKCIDKKKLEKIDNGMKSVLNEIKIMRALTPHEQIVNLHEVYEGDNNIYLIMDLAEGGSLYNEMKNRKYLFSRKEIQQIMKSLLLALTYIHSKGVMHRDLKPENILYQTKGDFKTMKLADFGLSTFVLEFPYLYPKCGTPGFVAPEGTILYLILKVANMIVKTEGYNAKCDVFSAGVIFHVLLFGEGVFTGKGHMDILKLNKRCELNQFHKKYDMIDQDARDLLFKLIEKDPSLRYSAMQGLEHSFFQNETATQSYPQLLKDSITGDVKAVTPGKHSPFHNFMQDQDNKTPDKREPKTREKQDSIITRTPLYKENHQYNKDAQFSDFALDKDSLQSGDQEVIQESAEEAKDQNDDETRRNKKRQSLQVNTTSGNQFNKE